MPLPERPWPVAPRPFADEPLGGWLGRVAAHYRMGVSPLCEVYGLDLRASDSGIGWLLLPLQPVRNMDALAVLARLVAHKLQPMQTDAQWPLARRQAAYCPRCVFLNDLDVTAPCWKRCWLDPAVTYCARHARPLATVPARVLGRCRNFDGVIQAVSFHEKRLRRQDYERGRHLESRRGVALSEACALR